MAQDMGMGLLDGDSNCFKAAFRWLFKIKDVSGSSDEGAMALPPTKSARPSLSFKTMSIEHLNETITRPTKPEWKPVTLVLYDLKRNINPVFDWIKQKYDPENGTWTYAGIQDQATLELYDGCGETIETWVYENVWIESADFSELDMSTDEYLVITLTLRYDRAYII